MSPPPRSPLTLVVDRSLVRVGHPPPTGKHRVPPVAPDGLTADNVSTEIKQGPVKRLPPHADGRHSPVVRVDDHYGEVVLHGSPLHSVPP